MNDTESCALIRMGCGTRCWRSKASSWWKYLCGIRDGVGPAVGGLFADGVVCQVGHGENMSFSNDPWLGGVPLLVRFRRLFEMEIDEDVALSV